jgi:hypothetical protein
MLGYINQLLPAMTGILGVATVWAGDGYLPRVGPVPLRFRAPAPVMVNQVSASVPAPFPPPFLPPYFPPVPIALPTPPLPTNRLDISTTSNVPPAMLPVTNGPALQFDAREPETLGPDAVVSPQMLLKFFSASTNANAVSNTAPPEVIAPLRFTPPIVPTSQPAPPTGSKATYSTSP